MTLGTGYSSDREMLTGLNCLKDYKSKLIGSLQSIIKFGDGSSTAEIEKDLSLSLAVSATIIPMVTGNAAISYSKYIQEGQYSQTFSFLYQVNLGSEVLDITGYGLKVLNSFGLAAFRAGLDKFREACGDKFVIQHKLGARLYVTLKLNFASMTDKSSFGLELGGQVDLVVLLVSIQLKYKQMSSKQDMNLNLEIAAYQEGGEVINLSKVLKKSADGTYAVMGCDVKDIDACQEIIQGILNYAKHDFKSQITYDQNDIQGHYIGNTIVIGNVYQDYSRIGFDRSSRATTLGIENIRHWMLDTYSNYTKDKEFLENLLYKSKFTSSTSATNTTTNITEVGYKQFDVYLSTVDTQEYGYNHNATKGYWTWSPEQIMTSMRFGLINLLKNITSNLFLLESKDVGIPKCYQTPEACNYLDMNQVNKQYIEEFKKAYQVIRICNDESYGSYALPIALNIYEEKSRFNTTIINPATNNTIFYSDLKYNITYVDPVAKIVEISLFDDELTRTNTNCGQVMVKENYDVAVIYETTFVGSCAKELCPYGIDNFGEVKVIFIEIDSPI